MPPAVELVVSVSEALDLASVPRVRALLQAALAEEPVRLVVDLTDCPFTDATGLGLLLSAHRQAQRQGTALVLRGLVPRNRRVLALAGLDRVLTVEPPVEPPVVPAQR